jgi:hypothetical protein
VLADHAAPWSIQARNIETCSAVSVDLPPSAGGMIMSASRPATNRIRGLSALLPGTIGAAAESPPRSAASRLSSRKPLFCFFGP